LLLARDREAVPSGRVSAVGVLMAAV